MVDLIYENFLYEVVDGCFLLGEGEFLIYEVLKVLIFGFFISFEICFVVLCEIYFDLVDWVKVILEVMCCFFFN